jgi:hypothetical protein
LRSRSQTARAVNIATAENWRIVRNYMGREGELFVSIFEAIFNTG